MKLCRSFSANVIDLSPALIVTTQQGARPIQYWESSCSVCVDVISVPWFRGGCVPLCMLATNHCVDCCIARYGYQCSRSISVYCNPRGRLGEQDVTSLESECLATLYHSVQHSHVPTVGAFQHSMCLFVA